MSRCERVEPIDRMYTHPGYRGDNRGYAVDMTSLSTLVRQDLATTQERLAAALENQGFGVLWELDMQAIFASKLEAEHEGHKILGVCNPALAKAALDADRDVALLLPCTATLREVEGGTEVAILEPERAFQLAAPETRAKLEELAGDAQERLGAAIAALG